MTNLFGLYSCSAKRSQTKLAQLLQHLTSPTVNQSISGLEIKLLDLCSRLLQLWGSRSMRFIQTLCKALGSSLFI